MMKNYLKSGWTYYYLLLVLMFVALGFNHRAPIENATEAQLTYFNLLWVHFVLGAATLLIGPLQLSKSFRKKSVKRHRMVGLTYVSCIFVSGLAGFWMAFHSQMPMFGYSLAILDAVWLYATAAGMYYAVKRKIPTHQLWMKRSFVITNVFVVFRFFIPIALFFTPSGQAPEMQFAVAVQIALWGMLAIFEGQRLLKQRDNQPLNAMG